jgi:MFS family permease
LGEAVIGSATAHEQLTPAAKKAIVGAYLGFAVDFYDIYLPTVALTPAIAYFLSKNLPTATVATLNLVLFAVTLFGRPIGSILFGHLGDVLGRRRTTLIAIAGFAVMTFLIALLPGYASWGYASIAILIALRLIDGIFMGGEYASNNPLAMEACPKRLRGLVGGWIQSAYPTAYVAIALTVTVMLLFIPHEGLNSPYVQWGWRIPFLIGAGLGGVFLIYYRRVEESKLWEAEAEKTRTKAPLVDLFTGLNLRKLAQVFLMMSGLWFTAQVAISATPTLLEINLKQNPQGVTYGLVVSNALLVGAMMLMAVLGQRYGRRIWLIISGVWVTLVSTVFYGLMVANAGAKGSLLLTMALYTVAMVLILSPWGIVTTYLNERFPTGVRASGYGVGYSLAVIIPSFFSFWMLGLGKLMPYVYTPLVLAVLGGILQTVGAWIGPETRDLELASTEEAARAVETGAIPATEPATV